MTTNMSKNKDQLLEEAIYWVTKLHSKQISHKEKVAFSKWLNESHLHEQMFDEINATWSSLGNAKYIPEVKNQTDRLSLLRENNGGKRLIFAVQFACLLLAMLGGVFYFAHKPSETAGTAIAAQIYETSVGEVNNIVLADGSKITLNTRSRVEVNFTRARRHLVLKQGEAFFEVAHDPNRPFTVSLGSSSVTAIGTAFNIYRRSNESIVTITEGIVKIKEEKGSTKGLQVTANHRVKLSNHAIQSIENSSAYESLAWQNKQLVFRGETLDVVFKELNRYLNNPVVLQDKSIQHLRLTGTFDVSNPEHILQALLETYELSEYSEQGYRFINRYQQAELE